MRGDTASAACPNTGEIRRFSVRNWITTIPSASLSASGVLTVIFAGGWSGTGTLAVGRKYIGTAPDSAGEGASTPSAARTNGPPATVAAAKAAKTFRRTRFVNAVNIV